MPSRVLVHYPEPAPPTLVDRPEGKPVRGAEYPPGWTIADFNLVRGDWAGEEHASEVWVVPLVRDSVAERGAQDPQPG